MKINNLILSTFLAITTILFNSCGNSSSNNSSLENEEGITESTQSGDDVTIGAQVWTRKNLNVSTYRNGDVIPQVQNENDWAKLKTGAWCYFHNDASNGTKYGKLYNWFAVIDPRGLAPVGYHIPTEAEWTILTNYLGGEFLAGKKMKSASGWYKNGNGTNSSGFSGLPGGRRNGDHDGLFLSDDFGYWWSSSEYGRMASSPSMDYGSGSVSGGHCVKESGQSVRCLRD